jgi:hypothetical protein
MFTGEHSILARTAIFSNEHDDSLGDIGVRRNGWEMARLAGLEPTTSAFAGPRSIQLSYKRPGTWMNGAEGEI